MVRAIRRFFLAANMVMIAALWSCGGSSDFEKSAKVTATGYTSSKRETSGNPMITAWGDRLSLDGKTIAVSRDLIPLGLTHNVKVKIEGLDGLYTVNDKMNRRWKKRIDIYFGKDKKAARHWGKKQVTISWNPPDEKR